MSYNNSKYLPRKPSFSTTSSSSSSSRPPHHRPEDAQPSEAITSNRRPTAPPQLVPIGQYQQAQAERERVRQQQQQQGQGQAGRAGGWANPPTRGGANGRGRGGAGRGRGGGGPNIHPVRLNRAKTTTAGSWADAPTLPTGPRGDRNGQSSGKGKERETDDSPAGSGSGGEGGAGGGGYVAFLAAKGQAHATPIAVPQNPRATLYVKGLPGGVTEEQVRSVFEKYGAVERVSVNHQSPTYCYAHVVFTHPTFASAALYALNCEPFPLPVASTSTSSSTSNTTGSSSSSSATPTGSFVREMHIQYSESDHSRRVSGGAGQAAFPASSSWLEGGGYEETNAALFRARETPVPSSTQQNGSGSGTDEAVKREPEASPVKPTSSTPASARSALPPASQSFSSGPASRPSSTPSIPDAPLLRTPSHQALHASSPLAQAYESSRSVFTSLYPLPTEYHPTSTHSGLIQAVRRHLREDRPDVLVYRHGFEGNGLRLVFAIHNEGEGEGGGRGEREWNLGERLRRERREVEREAQGQGQGEKLEPRKLGKKARRTLRKREAKRREEEERAKGRGVEVGASGGLVVEEEEEEEDGDEDEEDNTMDLSEGEGGANAEDEEVDELDEDDDGDAAVQQLLRPSSRTTVVDDSQPPASVPSTSTSVSTSAFPSSHTSALRPPYPQPAPPPAATTTAPTSVSLDDDGTQYERVPLPPACLVGNGNGSDAAAQRRRFLVEQVKRLHGEGKVVLSNSIEGDFLVLNYLIDESSAPPPASAPTPQPAAAVQPPAASTSSSTPSAQNGAAPPPPSLSRTTTTSTARHLLADLHLPSSGSGSPAPAAGPPSVSGAATVDVEMEDIKPVIPPSPARPPRREETDQLATPAPSEPEVPPARFPMKMQGSSNVDRKDTFTIVSPFLNLYYQRFDSSRASLESMYTSDAIFSLRISPTIPPRARSPVVPFSKKWLLAAQKPSSITPTSITNAIRELPAGSTDLDKIIFTARAVPEMGGSVYGPSSSSNAGKKRPTYPPILLHLTGEFEEFPEKVVRRFARTFILVPKSPRFGTGTDGPEYWIRSDQLTVLYRVEGEPRALPLQEKLFEAQAPRKRSASAGLPPGAAAGGGRAPPIVQAVAANGSPGGAFNPFANFAFGGQGAQFQPHASTSRQQQQPQQPPSAARPALTPAVARPSISTSIPAAPAPRPAAVPAASSALARVPSSDCIILSDSDSVASASVGASRSPELARRPAPLPQQQAASSKSLGKRRAAELSDSDVAIAGRGTNGSSPATVRAAQRQRTSLSTASSSSSSVAAAAAEQAEADRLGVSTDTLRLMVEREVAAQVAKLAGGAAPGSAGKGRKSDGGTATEKGKGGKAVKGKEKAAEKGKDGAAGKATKGKSSGKEKEKDVPLGTGLGPSDGRIIIPAGPSNSQLHTFDGRGNKLRHMIRVTPSSFLAVSFLGDVAEFSLSPDTPLASTRILQKNQGDDRFRVDEAAWSESKETLVVGYLGAKEPGVKELKQPPNQIVLYKREEHPHTGLTSLVDTPVAHKPHAYGGVTSVATLSGGGRLRFVTAGEDKKLFLWTRQRSTQALTTEDIRSQHSSTITSLAHLPDHNYIVSASKDKRLIAHDLSSQSSVWQALLPHPVMTVQTLTVDPNVVLARMGSPSNQFSIHDIRQSATAAPVLTFGIDLQPHRHGTSGALTPTNMGRYIRGEMCDSIFAFPDHEQGVKLWDLRNVRTAASNPSSFKRQHLQNIGRSKVVQAAFAGRDQLCLMELNHFTRVPIRG